VWFAGMMCIDGTAACYNNADFPNVDYKCTEEKPICVKADGSEPDLHSPGDKCVDLPWHVYSTSDDFSNSNTFLFNVDTHTADELNLKSLFMSKFLWVSETNVNTIVKIDTERGAIVGRYKTWPTSYGNGGNPAGLSLDYDGSVWVPNNRNYFSGGSMIHIGLEENGQCEDRNGNGVIDTSTGFDDLKPWADDTGTRGVATADDECIVHLVTLTSSAAGPVMINEDNDVWAIGYSIKNFDLVKGGRYDVSSSGTVLTTYPSVGEGGYAGLMDRHGVIWSSGSNKGILRWDPVQPLSGANGSPGGLNVGPPVTGTTWAVNNDGDSSGLCVDSKGNVWNTGYFSKAIKKFASDGTYLNTYSAGGKGPDNCVVHPDTDDVWMNTGNNGITRLSNDGTLLGNITVGDGPAALGVDRNGKIWVCNSGSHDVNRIDPALNGGAGGVDLTLALTTGAGPYTIADLAGSHLAPPSTGTWTVSHDSGVSGQRWGYVTWTATTPSNAALSVQARSSTDGVTYSAWQPVTKRVDMTVPDGRYLQVLITFSRATNGESPILNDVSISPAL